jgi:serine/threonine-protein kinase
MSSTLIPTGQTIAGYRIDGVLGSGGMGTVYRATQLSLGREVALKLLAPLLSEDSGFRERFRREAMLQAALEHPNIVTVYAAGESEEGLYLALRMVAGTDLKALVENQPLEPGRALSLLDQAAAALDAAHEAGLIHRDVKPQNILVDEDDHAYLADFGLTKGAGDRGLTLTGLYLGSLDYVAPEQVRGEPFGAAGDVYAFACVLYEALTGEVPFPHETEAALLYAHVNAPPPRPSVRNPALPEALDAVIGRGLAKQPGDRYRSAGELVREARRALTLGAAMPRPFGETITDPALLRRAPVLRVDEPRRVSPLLLALAAAICAGVAAAGFLMGHRARAAGPGPKGVAVAGPIQLSFPVRQWHPVAPQSPAGLVLRSPVMLRSTDPHAPVSLLAGIEPRAASARLAPATVLGSAKATPVTLGGDEALRYRGLRPRSLSGETVTLYALQTGVGPAAIACAAPAGNAARAGLARCESVAGTLALQGTAARPLGADRHYASGLSKALAPLARARANDRRRIAHPGSAKARADAATRLAGVYATAQARLAADAPGPDEQPANGRLLASLGRAQQGYIALAAAIRSADRAGYEKAAVRIAAAEASADRALKSLRPLGYAPS